MAESAAGEKDWEELNLEKLVFGDQAGFEANLRRIENLYEYDDHDQYSDSDGNDFEDENEEEDQDDLFFIDDGADMANAETGESDAMEVDGVSDEKEDDEENAWSDSDDEKNSISVTTTRAKKLRRTQEEDVLAGHTYVARLRAQFEKIYPRPKWADSWAEEKGEDEEYDEEAEEDAAVGANIGTLNSILRKTSQYVKRTTKLLPPSTIDIQRLKDANVARRSRGGIQGMSFHPLHPLLITGGFDRTLRVYHIDGKTNRFVSLVHFRDLPFRTVQFLPLAGQSLVYAAGRRRYMNRWDIGSGDVEKILRMYGQDKFQRSYEYFKISPSGAMIALQGSSGWVNIVNGHTGQFTRGLRVDGFVADFAFTRDEKVMIVANHAGDVWEFDLTQKSTHILRRWADTSAVTVTKIGLGGADDRWLAVGTKSGVVTLFDRLTFAAVEPGTNPKPFKEVDNLVTQITDLKFSPDGQVLCVSSKSKKDSLKLVHMPLGSVFSNWPTSGTPLGRVTTTEFSPNGQMLAVGNDVGKVTLWRLNHY